MRIFTCSFMCIWFLTILAGCDSATEPTTQVKEPIADLVFGISLGQSQNEWEPKVNQLLLNGTLKPYTFGGIKYHHYDWLLNDTVVLIDISFNGGGQYNHGVLRSMDANLVTEKVKGVKAEGEEPVIATNEGFVFTKYCSERKFARIKQYLDKNYGKPDSAFIAEKQESVFTYKKGSYVIRLQNSYHSAPDKYVSVPYYTNAWLSVAERRNGE